MVCLGVVGGCRVVVDTALVVAPLDPPVGLPQEHHSTWNAWSGPGDPLYLPPGSACLGFLLGSGRLRAERGVERVRLDVSWNVSGRGL